MVAGIILVSLGIKQTLAHVDEPLGTVPTFALLGGISIYLLAHVAFRLRLHSGLGLGPLTAAVVCAGANPSRRGG
jgi:Bacterial low temperature requirement A protein (LtrA)